MPVKVGKLGLDSRSRGKYYITSLVFSKSQDTSGEGCGFKQKKGEDLC
jgi:hypothetical protein